MLSLTALLLYPVAKIRLNEVTHLDVTSAIDQHTKTIIGNALMRSSECVDRSRSLKEDI